MSENRELRKGQFGHPDNPGGRPKGVKNKINALKLIIEQASLSENKQDIEEVIRRVIKDALEGDFRCRKLVWDAVMSKGLTEATQATDKVEIKVGVFKDTDEKEIKAEIVTEDAEFTEERPNE